MAFTRRTHIVRVPMDDPPVAKGEKPSLYIDLEVLDAIAFRTEGNKEVILSLEAASASPFIVDDTGGGHEKKPSTPTQRSHMERVKGPNGKLDVEVVDSWAARDQRGEEWILDMQGSSEFDISDGTGDRSSTRKAHDEIVSVPFGKTKEEAGTDYLTIQRSDNIAFRRVRNEEVILSIPSCDDPKAVNVNFGRASTFTTPADYDPTDDSDDAVTPPLLSETKDGHNYVKPVKGADDFLTGDTKIKMGPLWWIRKVASSFYVYFRLSSDGSPPVISFPSGLVPLYDQTAVRLPPTSGNYILWYSNAVQSPPSSGPHQFDCPTIVPAISSLQDALTLLPDGFQKGLTFGGGRTSEVINQQGEFWPPYSPADHTDRASLTFGTLTEAQAYQAFISNDQTFSGSTDPLHPCPPFFMRDMGPHIDQLVGGEPATVWIRDVIVKMGMKLETQIGLTGETKACTGIVYSKVKPFSGQITPTILGTNGTFDSEATTNSGGHFTWTLTRDTDDPVPPRTTKLLLIDFAPF